MTSRPPSLMLLGGVVALFISLVLVWIGYMLALGFRVAGMLCN